MHVDIAYVRDKQLIGSTTLYLKNEDKYLGLAAIKSMIGKFIKRNGYYYAKTTLIEPVDQNNVYKAIVDNCNRVTIQSLDIINTNIAEELELAEIVRELNYIYKNQPITESLTKAIFKKINNLLLEKFFIVKNLTLYIELSNEKEHKCSIICYAHVGDITPNHILSIKSNTEIYAETTKADIEKIYKEFLSAEKLGFKNLQGIMYKYLNHHTYIKHIDILFSIDPDGRQRLDNILQIRILSYLSLYNSFYYYRDQNKLKSCHMAVLDGNILNQLYFRIAKTYSNKLTAINLRYKLNIGYKKTIYIGSNLFLHDLMQYSDVNVVGKMKYFLNPTLMTIGRLSLKYIFLQNQLYISGVAGFKFNSLKIEAYMFEIENIVNSKIGINTTLFIDYKFISKISNFIGLIIFNDTNNKGAYIYSPYFSLESKIYSINLKFTLICDNMFYQPTSTWLSQAYAKLLLNINFNKYIAGGIACEYNRQDRKFYITPILKISMV